jgi:4a-hydroxytetrahydrobiopterin dehydratase
MSAQTQWTETKAGLEKTYTLKDFVEALAFTLETGKLAEQARHHPDIDIRWNKVKLTLITHDAGNRVTDKDRALAAAIDRIDIRALERPEGFN